MTVVFSGKKDELPVSVGEKPIFPNLFLKKLNSFRLLILTGHFIVIIKSRDIVPFGPYQGE
jgi:hypothetical protein